MNDDDFNKNFRSIGKAAVAIAVLSVVAGLAFLAGIIWLIVQVVQAVF